MLQCYSFGSSHPYPLLCPQVCGLLYLCLCLYSCPANRFISVIFLDSVYMNCPHSSSSLQAAREAPMAGLCKGGNVLLSDQEFLVALFFLFLFSMWQILIWVGCSLCARNCSRCWGYGGNQGRKDFWPQGMSIQGYPNAASLLRIFWITCLEDLIYPQIVRHSWGSSLSFPLGIPFLHYG